MIGTFRQRTCFSQPSIDIEGGTRIVLNDWHDEYNFKEGQRLLLTLKPTDNGAVWDAELI